jgi:hypothetical protein
MRKPTTARRTLPRYAFLLAAAFTGACTADSTAPSSTSTAVTPAARSMFIPDASSKALIGVADGTYVVTFDPTKDQQFYLGPNSLKMPANSVCNLLTSGYGTSYWNQSCTPQTLPVTLTVIIKKASSDHPEIDFFPAMRFNPARSVQLFMYVPHATQQDASNWLMQYCPDKGGCIDESKTDASLTTYVDRNANVVFRRVKHFSGYVIAGGRDDDSSGGSLY